MAGGKAAVRLQQGERGVSQGKGREGEGEREKIWRVVEEGEEEEEKEEEEEEKEEGSI